MGPLSERPLATQVVEMMLLELLPLASLDCSMFSFALMPSLMRFLMVESGFLVILEMEA